MRQIDDATPSAQVTAGYHALQFQDNERFDRALEIIDEVELEDGPLEYDLGPANIVVLPSWALKKVLPALERSRISYCEPRVQSISSLPIEEQARVRGLIWKRG